MCLTLFPIFFRFNPTIDFLSDLSTIFLLFFNEHLLHIISLYMIDNYIVTILSVFSFLFVFLFFFFG